MSDFKAADAFDVSDENPAVIANHLRALQREVRSGFEILGQRVLTAIERIEHRLDVITDRQALSERRIDDLDRRVASLEAKKRRKPAGRK